MLGLLTHCISCRTAPARVSSFPLCEDCLGLLRAAPPLCPACAGPGCAGRGGAGYGPDCERPWVGEESPLDGYGARYLLIEPGYTVLRCWKKSGGPLFDRRILRWDPASTPLPRSWFHPHGIRAIVPVPQGIRRSWRLNGSPAARVARWLGNRLRIPVLPLLLPIAKGRLGRQAELSLPQRLRNRVRFEVNPSAHRSWLRAGGQEAGEILLVDDFMTSGHTLRNAARVLRSMGVRRVRAYCLGVRPLLTFNAGNTGNAGRQEARRKGRDHPLRLQRHSHLL